MGAAVHGTMRRQVDGFGAAAVHAGGSARADDAEEEGKEEALGLHVIRAVCALAMVCPVAGLMQGMVCPDRDGTLRPPMKWPCAGVTCAAARAQSSRVRVSLDVLMT